MAQGINSKQIATALLLTTLSLLSACMSYHGAARVVSQPAGATVINARTNQEIGTTPLVVHFKESGKVRQNLALHFKKAGYYQKTSSFWLDLIHQSKDAALISAIEWKADLQKITNTE